MSETPFNLYDKPSKNAFEQIGARFAAAFAPPPSDEDPPPTTAGAPEGPLFNTFGPDWLQFTATSGWVWDKPFQHLLYDQLNRLTRGEVRRFMVSLPIRHSKSETVTVRYSAWRIERDPSTRIIVGAYSHDHAVRFSRKIRRLVRDRGVKLNPEVQKQDEWETLEGGGVRAAGVGGGVTGLGADLIVIDDPIKSRAEADSAVYRENTWEWYKDDLWTRQEPGCSIILIMSRWHEDDLSGRLIQTQKEGGEVWEHLHIPALAEEDDLLGRQPGQALWPERYDEVALKNSLRVLGKSFYALYQGRPQPAEGSMFRREWFRYFSIE